MEMMKSMVGCGKIRDGFHVEKKHQIIITFNIELC